MHSQLKIRKVKPGKFCSVLLLFCFLLLPATSFSLNNDDVLLVVDNREITISEFLRLWKKNSLEGEPQPVKEFMDLFVDFHLKVTHARHENIHEEAAFRNELARYRKKLARPYLSDQEMEEKLAMEAYERLLFDINASHILVRLPPGYSPEDTLSAWEKAMQIRERIIHGNENFEIVARATSDDPSVKNNSGNLGYFTALQMPYAFENVVYSAVPGEISMPVRTTFGYHLIRVEDKRKSRGEIRVAHIMIGFNQYEETDAEKKIKEIYQDLLHGYDFELMARDFSTDVNTAGDEGKLPWFGSGYIVPDFENAAFAINNQGEFSQPVKTDFGWHIIKLLDRRDIPPYDEIKNDLKEKIRESTDMRSKLIREALAEKLKEELEFSENRGSLNEIRRITDNTIFSGKWSVPPGAELNNTLFSINDQKITQKAFVDYIAKHAPGRNPWPLGEYIDILYSDFVNSWLIDYEDSRLEDKYPEFRLLMQEFKDGLLLFEITDRVVWTGAQADSTGLVEFYENTKQDYLQEPAVAASIFTAEDRQTARRGVRRACRRNWFGRERDNNWIIDRINRGSNEDIITVEKGNFQPGDREVTDSVDWNEGISDIILIDNKFQFVIIENINEPKPSPLEEVRADVLADFQEYTEQKWITELRNKYNVIINSDVLSGIK
jgi:peptidyl-prolyl cis-trans isomerase SurA